MTQTNRRHFLGQSAAIAGAVAFPWSTPGFGSNSPNARPTIGCIGLGGMGTGDARNHSNFGDIVAVCDVDKKHAERANKDEKIGKGKADVYGDYRKVLERKDIDVVSIVTPDHWHVKIAIEALEAGKHVFCQKPLTLTLEENQLIRRACDKHKDRTFFIGTQQRSSRRLFLRAVNFVQKGLIGDVKKITVGIEGGGVAKNPFKKTSPPDHLDWDMWLGQAPKVDYIKERCHGNFRWWYEYSGGKFTDWGAHHIDISLWAIGQNGVGSGPIEFDGTDANHPVEYKNGYATVDDRYNTAHDYNVKCTFENGIEMHVESRGRNGILFEGTKGRFFVNRRTIEGTPIKENRDKDKFGDEDLKALYKGKQYEGHKQNFYRCITEGGLPVSDVYTHLQTMNSCHLSAIAARLKRVVKWDPKKEQIVGDAEAAKFFARERRKGFEILKV